LRLLKNRIFFRKGLDNRANQSFADRRHPCNRAGRWKIVRLINLDVKQYRRLSDQRNGSIEINGCEMARFSDLEDVEKAAALNPATFSIPSADERKGQKVGASVRLHFLLQDAGPNEPRAERIWVTITQAQGLFKPYKGTLETNPVFFRELKINDEVSFKPCHIAQTIIKKDDPRWIDSGELKAFVSNMCLEKGNTVLFLYREPPDGKEDSGWRMFSGKEPEGYVDNPSNISLLDVGFVLDKDPTLLEPLRGDVGEAFEREGPGRPWQKIADWNPAGD
jgi:hypothetical protein